MATQRFTLRQLEIFATVVRTGQVKRAASALHLSQAAVSQSLQELADALGVTLFERAGREIVPTMAARQLLHRAAGPMAALAELPGQLDPTSADFRLAGRIRLAASSTIARYILPAALAGIQRAHPELDINVLSGNSAAVEARVASLDADIGFTEGPAERDDLAVSAWRTDTLQIIAPADYPAASVTAEALDDHSWVAREPGSGTRAVFEQSLALAGYPAPRARLVIDDSGAIVRAVAGGAGLACVSRRAATQASATDAVRFIDLPELPFRRPLWRLARHTPAPGSLIAHFMAALDRALDETDTDSST